VLTISGVRSTLARDEQPLGDLAIHVVAAERAVAAGALHLEHAVLEAQDRDVEGAAAQVVDREQTIFLLLETVRERRRGRLVQRAEAPRARRAPASRGGLPLGIVEVRGHRDHHAPHARS
jgi:hypothetical protein